jgi:tellurium resistance protein TerD
MELKKGNRINIDASKFKVGLGWDPSTKPGMEFDLDVSAFILESDGKVISEKCIVYYNSEDRIHPNDLDRGIFRLEHYDSSKHHDRENDYRVKTRPVSPNYEVIGSLDDKDGRFSDGEDDEDMFVDLSKIDQRATEIIIVVSIYDAEERGQNFGQVRNAYIRVVNENNGNELFRYELDEDFSFETAVEFGRIYKRNDTWRFEAMGSGTNQGLGFYDQKYNKF